MKVNKVTNGYVIQVFDTDEQEYVEQTFIPEDGSPAFETEEGESVYDVDPDFDESELDDLPLEMQQPDDIGLEHFEWYNVVTLDPDNEHAYFIQRPLGEEDEWEGFKTRAEAEEFMDDCLENGMQDTTWAVIKETRTIVMKGCN